MVQLLFLKNFDLQIPVSDIKLDIKNLKITISGNDVNQIESNIDLKFNIGIKDKTNYSPNDIKKIDKAPTVDSVMTSLGFKETSTTKGISRNNFESATQNSITTTKTTESPLNSEVIGKAFGVYNTTFSNPRLTLNPNIAPDAIGNFLTYIVVIDGKPNPGYYFEDETDDYKKFSFNIKITETTATWFDGNDLTEFNKLSFSWSNVGITQNTSNDSELEAKLEAYANGASDVTIEKLLKFATDTAKSRATVVLKNSHFILKKDNSNGYIKYSENKWQVKVGAVPDVGYEQSTIQSDKKLTDLDLWITVSISA